MSYRTKTYIAADWTGDFDAIDQIYRWNFGTRWSFHFSDAHKNKQCYDTSMPCTIKSNLAIRLGETKTFVLIVGNDTTSVRKGSCSYQNCLNKQYSYYEGKYKCTVIGKTYSTESFIEYECRMAYNAWLKNEMRIVVLYNAASKNKSKCPDILKDVGIHKEMKSYDAFYGKSIFDYQKVRDAIEG